MKFSVLKSLLLVSCFVGTFYSTDFETKLQRLESRSKKSCFLSKQILSFYKEAKKNNEKQAQTALSIMAKQIFKQDKNKETVGIAIIKDKELLKTMLDKIFQPAICGNVFKDLIDSQRNSAYNFIDSPANTENFINSKLVSGTKYLNYSIIFALIFFALHKLPKIEKISMEKVKKSEILNYFTMTSFNLLKNFIFNIIIDVNSFEVPNSLWQIHARFSYQTIYFQRSPNILITQ